MEIRFAKAQDVPGIIKLLQQVGKVHHEGRPDIFRENAQKYGPSQVLAMLEKSDNPIFVAVEDNQVLGYGFCMMETYHQSSVMTDRVTLYIDDLCVLEECRGRHIGAAIYEKILEYAKFRGCYNVTLNVWSCNEGAMKFYEKMGLKPQKVGMEAIL
jgi:ribosomal protein S18 acetylase RimI-like enzyme